MSAIVTFEIKTRKEISHIFQEVSEKWRSVSEHNQTEIIPSRGSLYITLSHYYANDEYKLQGEQAAIRSIVKYLRAIADDGKLYYFRDGFGDYPDHYRPIMVDELFTDEFEPSMNTEYHLRYEISCDRAETKGCPTRAKTMTGR